MEKKDNILERFEKASTVARNMVVIAGAVVTVTLFAIEQLNDPVMVTVNSLYAGGENMFISGRQVTVQAKKDGEEESDTKSKKLLKSANREIKGRLGEVTNVFIRNAGKQPVKLEVKIPAYDVILLQSENSDMDSAMSRFTLVDAEPSCAIRKSEIDITNGGVLTKKEIGSISIPAFPPDCSLRISIARTGSTGYFRWRGPIVEVFYDGKRARLKFAAILYGWIGSYAERIEDRGVFGVFIFLILPILLILQIVLFTTEQIAKFRKRSSKSDTSSTQ